MQPQLSINVHTCHAHIYYKLKLIFLNNLTFFVSIQDSYTFMSFLRIFITFKWDMLVERGSFSVRRATSDGLTCFFLF